MRQTKNTRYLGAGSDRRVEESGQIEQITGSKTLTCLQAGESERMDSSREIEFEARLARIEQAIVALQRSVDGIVSGRGAPAAASRESGFRDERRDPLADQVFSGSRQRFAGGPVPRTPADDITATFSSWFSSRTPEWWLSRLGIGFVILAVLLLYGYAIDKGWITPPIRVLAGTLVGGLLFWGATRTPHTDIPTHPHALGLRELFFGGGLAIWYVTAYAASVWYGLISIPTARLVFVVLAILSTWIALQERREIFATLAIATGFATPFILQAPAGSMTSLSLYVGLMAAMGVTIYLMRGWPSIIWLTFVAFWLSVAGVPNTGARMTAAVGSIALTILILVVTGAFVRVPSLRRQLLHLGSERYTPFPLSSGMIRLMDGLDSLSAALGGGKSAPDSLVLWLVPLVSPILAIGFLEDIWPAVPHGSWGVALLLLGVGAFVLARRGNQPDAEVTHLEFTAAVLWTVLGVERLALTPEGSARVCNRHLRPALVSALSGGRTRRSQGDHRHSADCRHRTRARVRGCRARAPAVGVVGNSDHRVRRADAQTLIEDPAEKRQGSCWRSWLIWLG